MSKLDLLFPTSYRPWKIYRTRTKSRIYKRRTQTSRDNSFSRFVSGFKGKWICQGLNKTLLPNCSQISDTSSTIIWVLRQNTPILGTIFATILGTIFVTISLNINSGTDRSSEGLGVGFKTARVINWILLWRQVSLLSSARTADRYILCQNLNTGTLQGVCFIVSLTIGALLRTKTKHTNLMTCLEVL
jgi:hypothetical protein